MNQSFTIINQTSSENKQQSISQFQGTNFFNNSLLRDVDKPFELTSNKISLLTDRDNREYLLESFNEWKGKTKIAFLEGTAPPEIGNWTISNTTIVEDSILIINGSILINETGKLILKNSQIYMNLSFSGEHRIDVYGNLTLTKSKISTYNKSNCFFVMIHNNSVFSMINSEISYAGYYDWQSYESKFGILIKANNTRIENSNITSYNYALSIFSSNNIIHNNTINGLVGILLSSSYNSSVTNNTISCEEAGIYLNESNNNIITDNTFSSYACIFSIYSINNTVVNNTINGLPLIYLENQSNITIKEAGEVVLINCVNIIIENLSLVDATIGIEAWKSDNIIIKDTYVTNSFIGFYLKNVTNSIIMNNIFEENILGIAIDNSIDTTIKENEFSQGITGIQLTSSSNLEISNNTIELNKFGLMFELASYCSIFENSIEFNSNGIEITESSNNTFYLNDITDPVNIYNGTNFFDNGVYGNYWAITGSDYNDDWILDFTYSLDESNQDTKPLAFSFKALIYPDVDLDKDGLTNEEEKLYGTNPMIEDTDSDLLNDYEELFIYYTLPTKEDTDDDRLTDWEEVKIYFTDPLFSDTDQDFLDDGSEVYEFHTDPNNDDTDGDGLFDGLEVFYYYTNPDNPDTDYDGLDDWEEINIYNTDPNNPDTDNDGYSDKWEVDNGYDPLKYNSRSKNINIGKIIVWITFFALIAIFELFVMPKIKRKNK